MSIFNHEPDWGPLGKEVYQRTYSREKQDGSKETWEDTVKRVVAGNLALVDSAFHEKKEKEKLEHLFYTFKALPAGRHLWACGVPGRQFLWNCYHAGWKDDITSHYTFLFDMLMQGGGVGANYSNKYIRKYGKIVREVELHIVCDPEHPDYDLMKEYVSAEISYQWPGCVSIEDTREGWVDALARVLNCAYDTDFNGKTLVFNVSNIRPKGSRIRGFGGIASGPWALAEMLTRVNELLNKHVGRKLSSLDHMMVDHLIASCVVAGNVRRSARMSIKNWRDPDIFKFLECKASGLAHWTTNVSVEIDNAFFRALKKKDEHALHVYDLTVTGMLTNGEPGFYNRSLAQVGELRDVAAPNPCGEITLEEWENCLLGHINLGAFHDDFEGACEAFRLITRFLIRATFGDTTNELQAEVMHRNRRIGVGFFGFQSWLCKQGIKYSESHTNEYVRKTLRDFKEVIKKAARKYAFELRIPEPIKKTTLAPTGTIAKMPGETESGQCMYDKYFLLRVRYADDDLELAKLVAAGHPHETCLYNANTTVVTFACEDALVNKVLELGLDADELIEGASEICLADHLAVQEMLQKEYVDNAIAFTINIPLPEDAEEEFDTWKKETKRTLLHYLPKLKGTTIMIDKSRPQSPKQRITKEEYQSYNKQTISQAIDDCSNGACPIK